MFAHEGSCKVKVVVEEEEEDGVTPHSGAGNQIVNCKCVTMPGPWSRDIEPHNWAHWSPWAGSVRSSEGESKFCQHNNTRTSPHFW